jgi:nitroimidazol reductase NimA-like FMN-containing flavoprotein (pyridoxamine 5'-phosphate oxidase superfamily)
VTSADYPETTSTTPARNRQRVSYDRSAVHAVLDEATVAHLGFIVDGRPVVLPQLYVRMGETLYLHASSGAGVLRMLEQQPIPVCLTVTLVDGLVLARSAFNHSVNYRSVVVHGLASLVVEAEEKVAALTALVDAVVPDRSTGTRGPNRRELAATSVLRLPLHEVSLKVRGGPPIDDDADLELPYWAGVLPVVTTAGMPEPAPDLDPSITLPDHVKRWADRGAQLFRHLES